MLRKTSRRLGGGGDLFPTSKEAAHLVPSWVMSRGPPPPPGRGRCYAATTRPATRAKWQSTRPEVHAVVVADIDAPSPPQHVVLPRPSKREVAATLAGVRGSLSRTPKRNTNGIAAANIAEKEQSEARMKTRDYAEHKRPAQVQPGWERTTDVVELSEWMYSRIHNHRKLLNDNSNGYEKEYMLWEAKPVAPAVNK